MIAFGADDAGDARRRSEFERREWELTRACALGLLSPKVAACLWWALNQQAHTWRWN